MIYRTDTPTAEAEKTDTPSRGRNVLKLTIQQILFSAVAFALYAMCLGDNMDMSTI